MYGFVGQLTGGRVRFGGGLPNLFFILLEPSGEQVALVLVCFSQILGLGEILRFSGVVLFGRIAWDFTGGSSASGSIQNGSCILIRSSSLYIIVAHNILKTFFLQPFNKESKSCTIQYLKLNLRPQVATFQVVR